MSQKSEEELIGTLVKLKKRAEESSKKIEDLLKYDGELAESIKENWGTKYEDLERGFKAKMSVNPDRIIGLAEKLRSLQKEYNEAHQELRRFEDQNLAIVLKYGGRSYY